MSNVFRYFFILICSAVIGSTALARAPRPPSQTQPVKVEKFTPDEKAFLAKIATKASEIVSKNLSSAEYQYNCIRNKNCVESQQILSAVRNAYLQYKTYQVMIRVQSANIPLARMEQSAQTPIIMVNDYSQYNFKFTVEDQQRLIQLRKDDLQFIQNKKSECSVNTDKLLNHYRSKISTIITLVPVVLLTDTQDSMPSQDEILLGYEKLIDVTKTTLDRFRNYDKEDLEGLWTYQVIAMSLASETIPLNQTYEQLKIKIDPQGFLEHAQDWMESTFFTYNALFIGCSAIAAMSLNPGIAMGCALLSTMNTAYNLYYDWNMIDVRHREWLSGVNSFDEIQGAKTQVFVDSLLLGFSVFGVNMVSKSLAKLPSKKLSYHAEHIKSNMNPEALKKNFRNYTQDFLKSEAQGQTQALVGGTIVTMVPSMLSHNDIENITVAGAHILKGFFNKSVYTYKDTAEAICRAQKNEPNKSVAKN